MRLLAALAVGWSAAAATATALGLRLSLPRWSRGRAPAARIARREWLAQAGLAVTPFQFMVASIGAAVTAFVALSALVGPVVALVPAAGVASAPRAFYGRRRARRLGEVQAAWPDGLRDLLASIGAGQSVGQAVHDLAVHGPAPLRAAFARYPALRRSLGTVPALDAVRDELADPTSDRVIEVLILAAERGGPIVRTVLEDLTAGITADLKVAEEQHTAMLESRINARAVVALPWAVLAVLNLGNGPFRAFYRSPGGLVTVVVGALMTGAGWLLVQRLGRVPTEPRVLGGDA